MIGSLPSGRDLLMSKSMEGNSIQICDNLAAINKPASNLDKVFQFGRGLELKYQDFQVAMLTIPSHWNGTLGS